MNDLWPHQIQAIDLVSAAVVNNVPRIVLTMPTGAGKSRVVEQLLTWAVAKAWKGGVYTNRRQLIDQLYNTLNDRGFSVGVRAAGFPDERERPIQISSIQTEHTRAFKREEWKRWQLHAARLLFLDEGHLFTNKTAQEVVKAHLAVEGGCQVVYVTATPIEMGDVADVLIQVGTMEELRRCKALVMAKHFGPDEPDFQIIKRLNSKEGPNTESITEPEAKKLFPPKKVWGRVWEWFEKLNPTRRPTLLFGPGVDESLWFAGMFAMQGVRSAHVDGDNVWISDHEKLGQHLDNPEDAGTFYESNSLKRDEVRKMSRAGEIVIVCNRFVMREGVDWPWLSHLIFATVFGNLQTYLQSGGRGMRWDEDKPFCTIQDHGGHWWRYGSLNADRVWTLNDTERSVVGVRQERLRAKWVVNDVPLTAEDVIRMAIREGYNVEFGMPVIAQAVRYLRSRGFKVESVTEPRRCPKCAAIMMGKVCPECGMDLATLPRSRPVITTSGEMKELVGDVFRPRRVLCTPNTQSIWNRIYWRACQTKWTVTDTAAGKSAVISGQKLMKGAIADGADPQTLKGLDGAHEAAVYLRARGQQISLKYPGMTFSQAAGLFARENFYHPPRDLKLMPRREHDWWKLVRDVPREDLF